MQLAPRTARSRTWARPQTRVPSPTDADDATLARGSIIGHLLRLILPGRGSGPERRRADEGEHGEHRGRHQDPCAVRDTGAPVPLMHGHEERPGRLGCGIDRAEDDEHLATYTEGGTVERDAREDDDAERVRQRVGPPP